MIPAPFEYARAESVEDAITQLSAGGEDAKALAGGHSLLPLMKVRLAVPTLLVDIGRLDDLRGIRRENGDFRIGALTTHAQVAASNDLGLAAHAASKIADQQVRNRGTLGGSLAHGDPAADMLAVLLASEGSVHVQSPNADREIAAADLFVDYLTTSIAPDELITSVRIPALEGYSYGYVKFTRRAEDWAMVGVCALVKQNGNQIEDARVAFTNMGPTPIRATATEEALRGQVLGRGTLEQAADAAAEGTDPPGDLNATPEYKRHLARVLTRRALEQATAAGS